MHIRQLEAAGHRSMPEGARVKVGIGRGQKGPEVTEIIDVLSGTVAVGVQRCDRGPRRSQVRSRKALGP
jgi:hypothetical protein